VSTFPSAEIEEILLIGLTGAWTGAWMWARVRSGCKS